MRAIDGDTLELKITSIATLAKSDAQKALMGWWRGQKEE